MVEARDRVSQTEARRHVEDVGLLVAAAHAEREALVDPPPLVTDARDRFIRRGALARLWMREVFEPEHEVDAIPDGDPILERALASPLHARPELYRLCQLVAIPSGFDDDIDGLQEKAKDPDWKATAKARIETAGERMSRYVHPGDPQPCQLMSKMSRFETPDDGVVKLRVEVKAFDLDACMRKNDAGECTERQWAQEWIDAVRPQTTPGFGPVFESRFGYHQVFLIEVLPAARPDDPATLAAAREAILDPWRAAAFDRELDALRKKRAVKVVTGAGESP
jgi:hypothetical protein